ncbi:ATP-binding cassette domain-containing protein, partial [bacterium]|nr:ATP-binding cassette domain-containing protein [bacterium]
MADPSNPIADRASDLAIEARDLSVRYQDAESAAIEGLDFAQESGHAVAIVGHTGAGKSTFLKCLNGLIPQFQRAE